MVEKERFLVVVSVLEGRKFPKRPRHQLLVEARFDGELLATDPVEHGESPDFTQELAWELDKKGLHQHRLQRTSVKVQVYAVDSQTTAREPVGYAVLDLRSAQNTPSSKWHTLLHTKYNRHKPELKLGMYIDNDKGPTEASFRATQAPARTQSNTPGNNPLTPRSLRPILNDSEGFYQIGPGTRCKDHFVLSVTVAFATNLPQLVPTSIPLPSSGFFFYYSLLGNDVTNETFHDLLNPTFAAERASVRIRSSLEALRDFFSSQPGLEVHLCCGDQSLGSSDISLSGLLKDGSTEIYMKPVSIEGAFELVPPARFRQQMAPVAEELRPVVGVSILLRREDSSPSGPGKSSVAVKPETKGSSSSPPQQPKPKDTKAAKKSPSAEAPPHPSTPSPPPPHDGSYTETYESESRATGENIRSLGEEVREKAQAQAVGPTVTTPDVSPVQPEGPGLAQPHSPGASPSGQRGPAPALTMQAPSHPDAAGASTNSSTQRHIAVTSAAHHFSFSIELRSVRNLSLQHHARVFLRYTYPFFGSAAPVMTQPAVEVRPHTEVTMPQGYCYFDFASSPQQLHDTFLRMPLVVELWDRQTDKASNVLLGAAQLSLAEVFSAQKARAVHQAGNAGWRQTWSDHVTFTSAQGEPGAMGELFTTLTLEDWGPLPQNIVLDKDSTSQGVSTTESVPKPPEPQAQPEPRETLEYKAAMELEVWKEQQEALFESQLKEKEQTYMRALAEEWRKRHKDRELLMQKKVGEYHQLEEKLQKTVAELDKREKQLVANEQEVLRLRADLQREHERKMTEMRDASHRMKADCDHQVQMQKDRVREHEETISRLKEQMTEAEKRYQQLSREFAAYREQQNSKPEVRLQSEINLLTLEKVELERKLDTVTKSKVHYKQQWGKALKELARLKERQQTAARAQLRKQQQELEHMRLRYLAAEEKEVVQAERQQLQEIKDELNHLKETEMEKGHTGLTTDSAPLMTADSAGQDIHDEHITRLIEERDSLLRTGVYTSEDRIIMELDRQIREAIATRSSGHVQRPSTAPLPS